MVEATNALDITITILRVGESIPFNTPLVGGSV